MTTAPWKPSLLLVHTQLTIAKEVFAAQEGLCKAVLVAPRVHRTNSRPEAAVE